MALGEYESQKALAEHLPNNSVVPIAYGTFKQDPTKSFFLTTYRELTNKLPTDNELVEVMVKLHQGSSSPTGKFGFHVTTFNGHVPLQNRWCDSWEQWYSRQLQSDITWEQTVRGVDPEFNLVAKEFFKKVIPRLLRPLQSGGRSIKPTLVHGDLWQGNAQFDKETKRLILFDSCCCYAHNESKHAIVVHNVNILTAFAVELHMMRQSRYRFNNTYVQRYKKLIQPSEPVEDFDDRNALYAMYGTPKEPRPEKQADSNRRDNIINAGLHEHRAYLREE